MERKEVKISFGIIVLNGEPFIKYNLRSLYRFAYEIIVVEGATNNAKDIANDNGHSVDATLEVLREFKTKEDPENKIKIITKNGFWSGKDEQSQAYAKAAKGNYLWQVDIDEFYKKEDMVEIIAMFEQDSEITAVSFKQITFFGSPNYKVDSWYLRAGADVYHRLFKWGNGYKYKTHRPPTVIDNKGRDLREIKWVQAKNLEKRNIYLYHYSLLLLKQVEEKARYYAAGPWGDYSKGVVSWCKNNFLSSIKKPFQVHNVHTFASWIEKYSGNHPEQITRMMDDIKGGKINIKLRDNKDIRILNSLIAFKILRIIIKNFSIITNLKYFPKKKFSLILFKIYFDQESRKIKFKI